MGWRRTGAPMPASGRRAALTGAVAAALAAVLTADGAAAQAEDQPRSVTVVGTGEAAATPELARVSLGVAAQAPTAAEAFSAAARAANAVFAALEGAGVPRDDLQTLDVALAPVWTRGGEDSAPRIEAYEARQTLRATVRALESLGPVLDAAAAAGAADAGGVSFEVADLAALVEAARRAAMADAIRTAGYLARVAGAARGPVLQIVLGGGIAPRPMMRAAMADAAPMPIAPGQTTVTAEVTVTFLLQ